MPSRLLHRLQFQLERWMLRGMIHRLLATAAVVGLVAMVAGLLIVVLDAEFGDPAEAIWWAFLRLTDPGYLGDDEGVARRTVSTIVTVLGYVLFLGALIAILTQWLNQTIQRLESGLTPITQSGHILILGWSNRTPTVLSELLRSEGRIRRFLARRNVRHLHVALLVEELTPALVQELRERLGPLWDDRRITLRTGSPLRLEHLRRVDFRNAAAILIPGADFSAEGPDPVDTHTIKTLLSISKHGAEEDGRPLPLAVAGVYDARKLPIARGAYAGEIEVLSGDAILSRLIAQNVRHRGLSWVYTDLLTHGEGSEIYVRHHPELVGETVRTLGPRFPKAVLLGAVRRGPERPVLNPPPEYRLEAEDRLVFVAQSYADCELDASGEAPGTGHGVSSARLGVEAELRRILVLGWSRKIPVILEEFDSYPGERFEIDVVSVTPARDREQQVERHGFAGERVRHRQLEEDYTLPAALKRLAPAGYDTVVMVASDWLAGEEESDARTILGYLLLRDLLPAAGKTPELLIELMDPGNLALFRRRRGEVLISPLILSHMLSQVVLRRELRAVFDELFGPGGAEIVFRDAAGYPGAGRSVSFAELQSAALQRGEIAIGLRLHGASEEETGGVRLNPPRDAQHTLEPGDELIVITTYS